MFLGISVISFAEVATAILRPMLRHVPSIISRSRLRTFLSSIQVRFERNICGRMKKSAAFSYFKLYLRESSIHSFFYIGSVSNWIERMFWFLTFVLSILGCVFMTSNLYEKLNFSAISILVDDRSSEVSEVPFPAVTIFGRYPNPLYASARYPDVAKKNPRIFGLHEWLLENNPNYLTEYCE